MLTGEQPAAGRDDPWDIAEPLRILGTSGSQHSQGMIDNGRDGLFEQIHRHPKCRTAKIGVTDRIQYDIMRRQRLRVGVEFRRDGGDFEQVVVKEDTGRNVAICHRSQHQQADRPTTTAIRPNIHHPIAVAALPMALGLIRLAACGQYVSQTLVRFGKIRGKMQRDFIVPTGAAEIARFTQQIAKVHVADRLARVAIDSLRIDRTRGVAISGPIEQGAESVQYRGIVRRLGQGGCIEVPRVGRAPERIEQGCVLAGQFQGAATGRQVCFDIRKRIKPGLAI
ncbi:MAG TPA: hypothetical protein VHU42_13570 [Rhodopila sp.]|nr:hypothetical protein [Rhodopila sp.]